MARKEKKGGGSEDPAWLITFSDLMTLLLTFFVLLLSMSVIDERRKLEALGSVSSSFSAAQGKIFNPKTRTNAPTKFEPGALEAADTAPNAIRDAVFDLNDQDVRFQRNSVVTIVSINSEVLFSPGSTELSPQGLALLDKLFPLLEQTNFPLLVAGHTGTRRDEQGNAYMVSFDKQEVDPTWITSFSRCMAVYQHYTLKGFKPQKLSVEAFGKYRPHFSNNTEEGRRQNRRVDLVLDTRDAVVTRSVERERAPAKLPKSFYFKDFNFNLDAPVQPAPRNDQESHGGSL